MQARRVALIFSLALLMHSHPALGAQGQRGDRDHDWCREQRGGRDVQVCEVREMTLPAGALTVDAGGNGGIAVEGWDGNDIRVEARVAVRGDSESEASALVDSVEVRLDGRTLEARSDRDRSDSYPAWWVSFRIRVPRDTDLELRTSNGGISVADVVSRVRFEASNGGVTLRDIGGDVKGQTSNGGLRVELSGDRWVGEGLDVRTTNGGVRLAIPEGYSARLETGTTNGSMNVGFPVTVQGRLTGNLGVDLGDGGATLKVRTTNGSVRVDRRS